MAVAPKHFVLTIKLTTTQASILLRALLLPLKVWAAIHRSFVPAAKRCALRVDVSPVRED